jgi:hypothetical protein
MEFVIDTGASLVSMPDEIFHLLVNSGTVSKEDMMPDSVVTLADGSNRRVKRFLLRKLQIGGKTLTRVPAMVSGKGASLLLGQSALKMLPNWKLDLQRDLLTFNNQNASSDPANTPKNPLEWEQKLVALYGRLLGIQVELLRATYDARLSGKLPPRLIIAQENLDKLSLELNDGNETKLPQEWRSFVSGFSSLVERYKSIVSLRVRSFEGEKTAERLEAMTEITKQEEHDLLKAFLASAVGDTVKVSLYLQSTQYPELTFIPGQQYIGAQVFDTINGPSIIPYKGSPAERAGLRAGDLVLALDGSKGLSANAILDRIQSGGRHRLELRGSNGVPREIDIQSQKFVPFGATTVTNIMIVAQGNQSATPSANQILKGLLKTILEKRGDAANLVYVWHLPEGKEQDQSPEALSRRRYIFDYVIYFNVESWQIESSWRSFVGYVRVCTCRVNLSVFNRAKGEKILQESFESMIDAIAESQMSFDLCRQRLTEQITPAFQSIIKLE